MVRNKNSKKVWKIALGVSYIVRDSCDACISPSLLSFAETRDYSQPSFLRFPDFHYRILSNNKIKRLSNGTFREAKKIKGL